MVNSSRYYRALESVSMIASALSTALAIYPCQIRVHQRRQSKLQLPTDRKKEWRLTTGPQRTVHPRRLPVNTVMHTTLVGLEPATLTVFAIQCCVRRCHSSSSVSQPLRYIRCWISRKPLAIKVWFHTTTNTKWPMGIKWSR